MAGTSSALEDCIVNGYEITNAYITKKESGQPVLTLFLKGSTIIVDTYQDENVAAVSSFLNERFPKLQIADKK